MSGTSVDGIDAALVEISGSDFDLELELLAGDTYVYPDALREKILAVCSGCSLTVADLAALDDAIADQFAQAALSIQADFPPVDLIGSHGQTVYHRPPETERLGYTLQLGRGAAIARKTNIPTVSNFRAADIAAGGQGAPLVSRVDTYVLSHPTQSRCVQNLGGIGNLTYLPANSQSNWQNDIRGWDTGPGNVLLDLAVMHFSHGKQPYDRNGAWAATGTPCKALVDQWLQHSFFQLPPPKSTGRELFGPDYFNQCLADASRYNLSNADLLATLTELTAASIQQSYHRFLPHLPDCILLCGGGSQNTYLRQRLQTHLDPIPVLTTDEVGLSANFKEAIAFAVLAYWQQKGIPGNLPQVTDAREAVLLGEIYAGSKISA